MKLLVWIRENGLKQGDVARAAGRSDAWISNLIRGRVAATPSSRGLVLTACRKLTSKPVAMADLFEDKVAA